MSATDPLEIPDVAGMSLAVAAVAYAEAGWSVGPLWWTDGAACGCGKACPAKRIGKHPIGLPGFAPRGLHDFSTHVPQVAGWWHRYPKANIGVLPPAGYLALDIDDPEQWKANGVDLPRSGPVQLTGSGGGHRQHVYHLNGHDRDGLALNTVLPGRGAETKGDASGYLVVPPSVTRGAYQWVRTGAVPSVPDALYAILPRKVDRPPAETMIGGDCCAIPDVIERNPGGHLWLLKRAGHLRTSHQLPAAARRALLLACLPAMRPLYGPGEGEATIDQIIDHDEKHPAPAVDPGAEEPPKTIGARTALELDYGPSPAQLAEPFIAPRGATGIYAKGGTGKGIVTGYLIRRLVRAGHVVMILDYEGHPEEWGSRLRGLGLTDDELRRVVYREPYGPEWTAKKGPLRDVAHLVRDDAAAHGATVLVVDSYTTATSTGDTMGGQAAAQEFFAGCAMVGLPVLFLAHVRGEAQRFPERPFGSVFVHNLSRETWAVEALPSDDGDPENLFAPSIVRLELRNMKRNHGGRLAPQFLTFAFNADGSIDVTDGAGTRRSIVDLIDAVLDSPMSAKQIAAAIREDTGERPGEETVGRTLRRHPRRFVADTTKRPYRWSRKP